MYQYLWDEETGGLLLTTEQSKFSKEPRPVYASELTILVVSQRRQRSTHVVRGKQLHISRKNGCQN